MGGKRNKTQKKRRNRTYKKKNYKSKQKSRSFRTDSIWKPNMNKFMKEEKQIISETIPINGIISTGAAILGIGMMNYFINSQGRYRKKTEKFKECLSDMKNILDKNGQEFFLVCGTLLGQKRENNFISHDTDIDIGIFRSALNTNIKDIISKSSKFRLHRSLGKLNESYEMCFKHTNGTCIDIFIYYPVKDKKDYYYCASFYGICNSKREGYCKWGNHIRGLKSVKFMNEKYLVPSNTEEYLIESYGKDWRVPKKFSYFQGISNKTYYTNLIN